MSVKLLSRALVSTTWLKKRLTVAPSTLKVLDTSPKGSRKGREDFLRKHIPSAQYFDLTACVTPTRLAPCNLPNPACLQEYVRSLGINKDDDVVLYDRGARFACCRAWWTFRAFGHKQVAVLDGGIKKWEEDGLETDTGEAATPKRGDFEVRHEKNLIKTYDEIIEMVASNSSQIVDVRYEMNFLGEEEEPSLATTLSLQAADLPQPTCLKGGHVKGSVNLVYEKLFNPEVFPRLKVFLEKEQLVKVFQEAGIDLSKPITAMCYVGNASCILALAAHLCGKEDVSNYVGSWTEFGQLARDEFIRGPEEKNGGKPPGRSSL